MHDVKPDRILGVLVIWSAITFVVFWLPAVRGLFDGPSYTWSLFGFSGRGTSGDYWFPAVASIGAVGFFFLAWRGAGRLFQTILVLWHLLLAGGAVHLAISEPDSFRFRGDTLGIDLSLAWGGPVLFGGFSLLAMSWVVRRGQKALQVPALGTRNRRLAYVILALLPVQFLLLRSGPPHGASDQLGVLLTLVQWGLITAVFHPWSMREAPERLGGRSAATEKQATSTNQAG